MWDLDLGYDNSSERSLLKSMEAYLGLWNRPFEKIIQRMWQDPWFASACSKRLNTLIDNGLQRYLISHIDSLRSAIWQTQSQNFQKWPIKQEIYSWAKHAYYNDYDSYIRDLKNFVNVHIPYLQEEFNKRAEAVGIHDVPRDDQRPQDAPMFDLNGRRIQHPTRGIYIQNGRKMY